MRTELWGFSTYLLDWARMSPQVRVWSQSPKGLCSIGALIICYYLGIQRIQLWPSMEIVLPETPSSPSPPVKDSLGARWGVCILRELVEILEEGEDHAASKKVVVAGAADRQSTSMMSTSATTGPAVPPDTGANCSSLCWSCCGCAFACTPFAACREAFFLFFFQRFFALFFLSIGKFSPSSVLPSLGETTPCTGLRLSGPGCSPVTNSHSSRLSTPVALTTYRVVASTSFLSLPKIPVDDPSSVSTGDPSRMVALGLCP